MIDPNAVMVWIGVGRELFQAGRMALKDIRAGVADDPEANNAKLDELDADYDRRIERREEG